MNVEEAYQPSPRATGWDGRPWTMRSNNASPMGVRGTPPRTRRFGGRKDSGQGALAHGEVSMVPSDETRVWCI